MNDTKREELIAKINQLRDRADRLNAEINQLRDRADQINEALAIASAALRGLNGGKETKGEAK